MGDYTDPFMRNRDAAAAAAAAVQARTKAVNRANVLQLKLIGQSHPTGLTSNLLKLFEPRPPLEYKPPPEKRKLPSYTGMAQFLSNFAEPGDPEYAPPPKKAETPAQRRSRVHKLRLEEGAKKAAEELEKYDPSKDPNISGDPYKTLFVARLNYETTEHRIKREFEAYGPIKKVRAITDKETNKPRGYAFIEYMHTRDMKAAYKQADGRKLDNRRVLVDVERGRTVPNWRPRRLGGGLGSTRVGGAEDNQKYSGREPQQIASGGRPRSEEPRTREDRHEREREKSRGRGREKSRERGRERDREREKSREHSYDRMQDRDPREERHHRDRERNRDRDRERDRGRNRERDRHRDRDHGRDYDRDRERGRDRPSEKEKDYEYEDPEHDHRRSRDREHSSDRVEPKRERNRRADRDREFDHVEPESDREPYDQVEPGQGFGHREPDHEHGQYDHYEHHQGQRQKDLENQKYGRDHDHYDGMEPEDYPYNHVDSESHERERTHDHGQEYHRSKRSLSREYEH